MTVRIARAIKLAGIHPAVLEVRVLDDPGEDGVVVEFDLATELPAAWRQAGASPSGVREVEPVRLDFPRTYPLDAPKITLRRDFNRRHPHINPGSPDDPPSPCVIAGSPRELIQSRGIEGLVDQIADWLDKASMVSLNDPAQGWEPVRRDHIDDLIVIDGAGMRGLADPAGGSALVQTGFAFLDDSDGGTYGIDHTSCIPKTFAEVKSARMTSSPGRHAGVSHGMVFWAGDRSPGEPFMVDDYEPETVTTMRGLRERAASYGCSPQFDGLVNQLTLLFMDQTLVAVPLAITFLVRRPFNLAGTLSPIELCSYVIHLTSSRDLLDEDRPIIRLCGVRERLSVDVLRQASGEKDDRARASWSLVGCGSVGSKIAVHAARRGRGPSIVIDCGFMEPHNYARHALLPGLDSIGGGLKAQMLAEALAPFQQPVEAEIADVVSLLGTEEGRVRVSGSGRGILNATASTVVRERLAFLFWKDRPSIGEAHLLGSGHAAYAAFEGEGGNPNLSDLAAESYRLIAQDPGLRCVVFDTQAEAIAIGQGCSALTFPMPDNRLSALTAGLSEVVALRKFPDGGAAGEIRLGKLESDGLSQTWMHEVVEPLTVVSDGNGGGIGIRISARVDRLIREEVARRPDTETGGVIVGRFSHIGDAFQVVDILPAPPDSSFSAHEFVLGTIGLKAAIRRLERETGGSLRVLGTWHNHLVTSGPSGLDSATAAKLALRQFLPVLLLIALPNGYTALVAEAFDFTTFAASDGPQAEEQPG